MSAGLHPAANPRRRRRRVSRPRRNAYFAKSNPRRKRRSYRRRNEYLRNPRLLGFELPNLRDSIAAGVGFLVPPVIENLIAPYLPSVLTTNIAGRWATRVGSVAVAGAAVRNFVGRREGNLALIGGGVWLVSTAVNEFMPGLLNFGVAGMGSQPLLGAYPSLYSVPMGEMPTQTRMTYDAPDRLQPQTRF